MEDLAFRSVLRLAEHTGAGLYFVHVTAKDGVDAIAEARSRGMPVYGEVLTLALSFNCDRYREEDGMKYHTFPSLKYEEDRLELWKGLKRQDLSFTATDSSFTTYLDKIAGRNVVDMRGGNIGIEIRMGVNYTEAVVKRGMSLEHYAAVTSTNAAKLLGLYPSEGRHFRRQRCRYNHHRPVGEEIVVHGGPPPARLQPMGRMGGGRMAYDSHASGQFDGGPGPTCRPTHRWPVNSAED